MKIVLHSEVLLGMEQLLIAFVQRVEWAQELLKENCGERKALWCARRRIPLPRGMTRRLRHGSRACSSMGRSHFSFDGEAKCAKESRRHGDSRGGPPRCALFANIGVPGTAVPGSCICSGLPVANCLRQLCPLGTRSLSAQASVCGSPFGAVLGLGSLRSPAGKSPLMPIFERGSSQCRAQTS